MNIVLTWKNALYQETFSKEQRSMLVPENPLGMLNLTDEDLANVQGGNDLGLARLLAQFPPVPSVTPSVVPSVTPSVVPSVTRGSAANAPGN